MNKNYDLTTGSLWKKIFLFSLPLVSSNILQVLFNMSDVMVAGQFAGTVPLGSVGSTSLLVSLFIAILIGLASGINVIVARFFGAKDSKNVLESVHTSMIYMFIAGCILMLFCLLLSEPLLRLLKTKDTYLSGAILYLRVYSISFPAMAIYNAGNGIFSALGDTRKPLIFLFISGIINVVLNLFFVIVCKIDVLGVALASNISIYVSAICVLIALFKKNNPYNFTLKGFKANKLKVQMITHLGLPAAFQNSLFSLVNLFVQASINSFDDIFVAGNSAAANADNVVYNIMDAFYVACTSFMGQNIGAGKKERVLKSYFISIFYSFFIAMIVGFGFAFGGRIFLRLFTTDQEVIEAGMIRLKVMGLSYCVSAFMDCTTYACRSLNKTIVPTIIVFFGAVVFRIIWIFTVFNYFKTPTSLYTLFVCSWVVTATAEIIYFSKIYRKYSKEIA